MFLKHFFSKFFLLSLVTCHSSLVTLFSTDIFIQIQRGEKVTIGLPGFVPNEGSEPEKSAARQLEEVTKNDILFSRLFNLVQEGPAVGQGKIDFAGWETAGADLLVTGNTSLKEDRSSKGEGTVQLVASVYEMPNGNPIFQKIYRTRQSDAALLAHEFVADLLLRFTGNKGVSRSKIAFCNDATGSKELYVIDYDGQRLRRLSADKSVALLPRWSPNGEEIAFTSFRDGNPDLYLYSVKQGASKAVSLRKGLNSCASFSPDGEQLVITLSHQGYPNLYLLNRKGEILRRLTKAKAADTSASFSPDGRKIIFTSDRPGGPQIYMMDADGSNVARLTSSGYCDAPSWSPLGDKVAYSRGTDKGKHDIVIQDLGSGEAVQLTQNAGNNENPSFSPDGRFLVFTSTRNKKRELFIASIDGTVQRKLTEIEGNCYTPSWGP